jgi:hypothetical protein
MPGEKKPPKIVIVADDLKDVAAQFVTAAGGNSVTIRKLIAHALREYERTPKRRKSGMSEFAEYLRAYSLKQETESDFTALVHTFGHDRGAYLHRKLKKKGKSLAEIAAPLFSVKTP